MNHDFSLIDILGIQADQGDLQSPLFFHADEMKKISIDVSRVDDEKFTIRTSISAPFPYRIGNQSESHIRHDFVATKSWGSTDESLRLLGIDSKLTPDCIDPINRRVLELATSLSSEETTMNNSFIAKRVAYESLLQDKGIKYFILVVSPTRVMTNCNITQSIVDELCMRCRCGLSLERQIEKQIGRLLHDSSGDTGKDYGNLKNSLSKTEHLSSTNSMNFNKTLIDLSQSLVTSEEEEWVASRIKHCLNKAKAKIIENKEKNMDEKVSKMILNHKESVKSGGVRENDKRCCIFPMVVMKDNPWSYGRETPVIGRNKSLPAALFNLWDSTSSSSLWPDRRQHTFLKIKSKEEASTNTPAKLKHDMRHRSTFTSYLSKPDLDYLALSGVGAKAALDVKEVIEKERNDKLGFSPDTNVSDIQDFIHGPYLNFNVPDQHINDDILETILQIKNSYHPKAESIDVFRWMRGRALSQHASLITDICTELSYEYKTPHKPNNWGFKVLRNQNALLLYRSTGTHLFFSVAMEKKSSMLQDPGKIGPTIYETENYYISDFSSISEDGLDHFVKALPYVMAIQSIIAQLLDLPLPDRNVLPPDNYWQMLKTTYLLYLNNKLDSEEIVTSLRYLYMNLVQESFRDVCLFESRLPSVLRSRLSVYLLSRVYALLKFYAKRGIRRVRLRGKDGNQCFKLMNVKSIFCMGDLTMPQLINSFYFGYVVSKSRGKIGDRNVKVLSKVMQEEFWFLDNIKRKNVVLWERREEPLKHCWDSALLKISIDHHLSQMNDIYGGQFSLILENDLLNGISRDTFSDIATLKASSREEQFNFFTPNPDDYPTYKELKAELLKQNPTQDKKRPRVITKLFQAVAEYISETKNGNPKLYEVSIWALLRIRKMGYFVSDCFAKDQHGGDREIHVLHIYARLAQHLFERISRTICKYYPNDSILNPKYKDVFYSSHQRSAQLELGDHYTIGKSADATKWCQRHHSSKFFLLVARYLPSYMIPFAYIMMELWTRKRIMLPIDIIANFDKNRNVKSSNEFYKSFKERYYNAKPPFVNSRQRNTIVCESGMWQGILHITSTLLHSCIQNFWKTFARGYLSEMGIHAVVDVVQGSDDSAALISVSRKEKDVLVMCEIVMMMKEYLSEYLSIFMSEGKSSICSINMVEYNSEWVVDNQIIKPTTRWALACLETSLVEKFVTRLDIYYGTLSQTLESGGSTFLCALIQMSQSYMHYMLLGCRNNILKTECLALIQKSHLVPLGFFPLDSDLNAGLTGLDFLMYRTHRLFDVPTHTYDVEELGPSTKLEYDGKIDKSLKRDINSTFLGFSSYNIWNKLLEEAEVETIEDLLIQVDRNPRDLFLPSKNWKSNKIACSLKLYEPGVKSSISSYQPNIRMMSSSSYVITKPCMSSPSFQKKEKHSLYELLINKDRYFSDSNVPFINKLMFPHQGEYSSFHLYLEDLLKTYFFQVTEMTRSNKSTILIWGSELVSEFPLLDICIRGWWGVKTVKISESMFQSLWSQTKAKYGFLKDSIEDTCDVTGLNSLELYHFLQSISKRQKKLRLQDTPARDVSKESALTRIYWPALKVRSPLMKEVSEIKRLRHYLFCLLQFPYSQHYKRMQVVSALTSSPILQRDSASLTRQGKRLKIMSDFLVDGDVQKLVLGIELLKRGSVGFFSQIQGRGKGPSGQAYQGRGEWLGKICGISCKILMEDANVKMITISRLADLIEMSSSLRYIIREFKCTMSKVSGRSPNSLYLSDLGNFENHKYPPNESVPLTIDPNLEISVFDRMLDYDWKLKVTSEKIKIVCQEKSNNGDSREFTVLSDTFTNRDWDASIIPTLTDDILFNEWQTGQPASMSEIIRVIGSGVEDGNIRSLLSSLMRGDILNKGNYDLREVARFFRRHIEIFCFDNKEDVVHMEKKENDMKNRMSNIHASLVNRLLSFVDPLEDVMDEFQDIIQEESDSSPDEDGPDLDVLDENVMDHLRDMFFSLDWTYEEEIVRNEIFSSRMPMSNLFFSPLTTWLEMNDNVDLLKEFLIKRDSPGKFKMRLSPEVRLILSLSFNSYFPTMYDEHKIDDIQVMSRSEASISSFTENFMETKNREDLQSTLDQLESITPSTTGALKKKFESLIQKYKLELLAIDSVGELSILGKLHYWHFMELFINIIIKKKLWEKDLHDYDIFTARTILISDSIDKMMSASRLAKISETSRDEMLATSRTESLSKSLINLLSIGLELQIDLFVNDISVYITQSFNSHRSVDIRLIVPGIVIDKDEALEFGSGEGLEGEGSMDWGRDSTLYE